MNLIRALFPHWNFYDRLGYGFDLEVKTPQDTQWRPITFKNKINFLNLFINPNHNLNLAQVSIIEYFVREISELKNTPVTSLATYKMLISLIECKLNSKVFEFRIMGTSKTESEEIFRTEVTR